VLFLMKINPVRICVPVCVRRASELAGAVSRATEVGDMIELRLDCLSELELEVVIRELHTLLPANSAAILTMRSAEQGGHGPNDHERRNGFWSSLRNLPADCRMDLECDLVESFAHPRSQGLPPVDWQQVICSHHDFVGMPGTLEQIYQRMTATPARIVKIAVQADDAIDCLPIFQLLERAQRNGREMIAIAMGQAGIMTRILGPSRGAFLTYGALDDKSATAPGQLTARDLREVYRIDRIDPRTEITGLIGQPVAHSLSPHIHNAAFAKADLNAVFIPLEVRDVDAFMRRMVRESSREIDWNVRGFSVTAPHKSSVMKHLDWIEPAAKEIGAVNTVVLRDGALNGYNTDARAFRESLKGPFESLESVRCAIIGAGGAARAIVWALQDAGASVSVFARDAAKARLMAAEFQIDAYDLAAANFEGFDILVNATPLGTRGPHESETPATANQLRGVRLAYDLVYNPLETRFMRAARDAGCQVLGGLEMLIAQAVEQFKLWTNQQPDIDIMRAAAKRALDTAD
jgi:3-dehydroquinate dehydratase/shikimate dehydrogenase